jgi:hypothetical protein
MNTVVATGRAAEEIVQTARAMNANLIAMSLMASPESFGHQSVTGKVEARVKSRYCGQSLARKSWRPVVYGITPESDEAYLEQRYASAAGLHLLAE